MKHYKAIIIGSGQGGVPLAKKLANNGWQTALIEKKYIGGTCVNVGCTPTKTMIASAKVAYTVANAAQYGVLAKQDGINIQTVLSRKKEVVQSFRNGSQKGLEGTENVALIFGTATFTGEKKIKVLLNDGGEEELTADYFFIDTGTRPAIPDIDGLEEAGYFTSTTLMEYEAIPQHLLIIGGGYVGLEFGQMYRRFGSSITVLEHGARFLSREDEDIAAAVEQFLKAEEINIHTNADVVRVQGKAPNITATVKINGEEKEIACSHILVSAGRIPNTEELNVTVAGIQRDKRGFIIVDDKLQTTAAGIYAIGDVNGGPQFTHISYNDYVILYHNLVEGKTLSTSNRLVPYTMFTDPQLGRVGITEQEAKKKSLNVKIAILPMTHVARAIETGDTRGMIKAIVDAEKDTVLGVAVVNRYVSKEDSKQQNNYNSVLLRNFQKLIDLHYKEKKLTKDYAAMLYVTPNHLNALSKDITGCSAGELIRDRILLEAKRLLVNAKMTISEIALELDFADNSYFSKFFKKYEGVTPEVFRKQIIKK